MDNSSLSDSGASNILAAQHRRIEQLFLDASADPGSVNVPIYDEFRKTLLRHIAIEENIVLPLLRKHLRGGFPMELQLRMEHDALAALCVLPPTIEVLFSLHALLIRHDRLEEAHGTLYDLFDDCVRRETDNIPEQIATFRETATPRYINNPLAIEYARRAIARAGYDQNALMEEGKAARDSDSHRNRLSPDSGQR
ncbi:MAG: hemerythrin domain-containing protein [Bacteroidia bacterium]|nr:hemerythrin domain-containing protein [Bacteroidia bacterium]